MIEPYPHDGRRLDLSSVGLKPSCAFDEWPTTFTKGADRSVNTRATSLLVEKYYVFLFQ